MRAYQVYFVCLALWAVEAQVLPSGRTLNKQVSAVCLRNTNDNSYTMTLSITFNGDPVDRVQFLTGDSYTVSSTGTDNEAACTVLQGSVTSSGSVLYRSTIYTTGAPSNNACGGRVPTGTTDQAKWTILTREHYSYGILTDMDRLYTVVCTDTNSNTGVAYTSVNVYESDAEGTSNRIDPVNTLSVLTRTSTGNFDQEITDGVRVNELVRLRVQSRIKDVDFRNLNLDHYGVYVYDCRYWFDVNGQKPTFITSNGCANNEFPDLSSGFVHTSADYAASAQLNLRWFQTNTGSFILLSSQPPNNYIHISCYVDYCYGPLESDSKCNNYCAAAGRRKRQTSSRPRDQVSISIKVIDDRDTLPGSTDKQESNTKAVLIGVTSGLVVFVLLIGAIIMAVVCCRNQGARQRRMADDNSSVTSSRQNLPAYLSDVHVKQQKY